jgi:hypothetical protein
VADVTQLAEHRHARTVESLRDLVAPDMPADALERCAELIDKHPDHRGLFIVAGVSFGPHLTASMNVGALVTRAHEPCVVVDLDLLLPPVEASRRGGRW